MKTRTCFSLNNETTSRAGRTDMLGCTATLICRCPFVACMRPFMLTLPVDGWSLPSCSCASKFSFLGPCACTNCASAHDGGKCANRVLLLKIYLKGIR